MSNFTIEVVIVFRRGIGVLAVLMATASMLRAQELGLELVIEQADGITNTWREVPVTEQLITASGRIRFDPRIFTSTGGFYRLSVDSGDREVNLNEMIFVTGGNLPTNSPLGGQAVASFHLGRFELNWFKWLEVRSWSMTNGYDIGSAGSGCQPYHPVQSMRWLDAVKWCNARSEKEGLPPVYYHDAGFTQVLRSTVLPPDQVDVFPQLSATGYRLPTEAEWEFAARGGTISQGTIYSGSDVLGDVGWYRDNTLDPMCVMQDDRGTFKVGLKLGNELGFHDMSGNIIEWCWDPHVVFDGVSITKRRCRGGSWFAHADVSKINTRLSNTADYANHSVGVRVARSN